jgi:hypothetical protein
MLTASMRRPASVNGDFSFRSSASRSRPTNGRQHRAAGPRGPLSLISVGLSDREGSVKGALLLRGLRTLDRSLPIWNIESEGKGAGGLRGRAPWRSMRQRLMRALRRADTHPVSADFIHALLPPDGPSARGSRALSPRFHPHSHAACLWLRCPLVFSIQWGAAI